MFKPTVTHSTETELHSEARPGTSRQDPALFPDSQTCSCSVPSPTRRPGERGTADWPPETGQVWGQGSRQVLRLTALISSLWLQLSFTDLPPGEAVRVRAEWELGPWKFQTLVPTGQKFPESCINKAITLF